MGAPSPDGIYRAAGRLIKAPANKAAPSYGGTVMGAIDQFRLREGLRYVRQGFEELGRTGEIWQAQDDCVVELRLRQWDPDALAAFFPNYSSGVVTIGASAGPIAASKGSSWAFIPDRASEHPGIYIPNGVPLIEASETSLRFSVLFELNVSVFILALPVSVADPTSAKIGLVSGVLP